MNAAILCKERRRCRTGKVGFYSKLAALFAIAKIQGGVHGERYPRRAYFCQMCRRWHLTSMTREGE
jgi:hypothetical protein